MSESQLVWETPHMSWSVMWYLIPILHQVLHFRCCKSSWEVCIAWIHSSNVDTAVLSHCHLAILALGRCKQYEERQDNLTPLTRWGARRYPSRWDHQGQCRICCWGPWGHDTDGTCCCGWRETSELQWRVERRNGRRI